MRTYSNHGMTGTKLHEVWKEMKRRCKHGAYRSACYKKRNIHVCDEWQVSQNFIDWALDNGYKEGLQIDRIDNDKGYYPGNCRFVTPKQNANNRSNTIFFVYEGEKMCLSDWADKLGINKHTLYTRYSRGWSVPDILTREVQSGREKTD